MKYYLALLLLPSLASAFEIPIEIKFHNCDQDHCSTEKVITRKLKPTLKRNEKGLLEGFVSDHAALDHSYGYYYFVDISEREQGDFDIEMRIFKESRLDIVQSVWGRAKDLRELPKLPVIGPYYPTKKGHLYSVVTVGERVEY